MAKHKQESASANVAQGVFELRQLQELARQCRRGISISLETYAADGEVLTSALEPVLSEVEFRIAEWEEIL